MTDDRTLTDAVTAIMADRRPRSAKWILRELGRMGIEDVTPNKVSYICRTDPMIETIGIRSHRAEFRRMGP